MTELAIAPTHPTKVVFLGTPRAAVPPLRSLVEAGFDVAHVISRPDRRRSRRGEPEPSPVKAAARDLGISVSSDVADALDCGADLGVVVAFGKIIPTSILEQLAMVNLHFSLLPRWRGAAPVERAILAGDEATGVCVMNVEPELDTGPVHSSIEVEIGLSMTATELTAELSTIGARLLVDTLRRGLGEPTEQVGEPTYAHKITNDDLYLDFGAASTLLERTVRVGGAWTTFRGERFKIWDAMSVEAAGGAPGQIDDDLHVRAGVGSLRLEVVQAAGRPRSAASDWANGARLTAVDRLGS